MVEFEFCEIVVCHVLSICIEHIEVKLSVIDFDGYEIGNIMGLPGVKKAHVTKHSTKSFCCHGSGRGETEGAFIKSTQ